ncbi:hypothetical protein GOP47_0000333 [Adiantum capillus-veneris]|uniref:Pentatricopeptide repeat-containing protein n=1 Tax=Adiantum capillus-veneris TaxID=13818 RepID=A0A9D4VD46_ADICA|nr:hypothetical protein GOP47_0000333 [Adiantum capillus-veneris]
MKLCPKYPNFLPRQVANMEPLPSKDIHLRLLCKQGHLTEVMEALFLTDIQEIDPDTCLILLETCIKFKSLVHARHIHSYMMSKGLRLSLFLNTRLVDMYAKTGSINKALGVFNQMLKRDVVVWNALIGGYAKHGAPESALELFSQMGQDGILPDEATFVSLLQAGINPSEATFVSVLNACANSGALDEGKEMHSRLCMIGLNPSVIMECTFVDMYAKGGCIQSARAVFDQMKRRDSIAWNAMIAGYSQHGQSGESFMLFQQMKVEGPIFLSVVHLLICIASVET